MEQPFSGLLLVRAQQAQGQGQAVHRQAAVIAQQQGELHPVSGAVDPALCIHESIQGPRGGPAVDPAIAEVERARLQVEKVEVVTRAESEHQAGGGTAATAQAGGGQARHTVAAGLGRSLCEVPVGFKWFVDGLLDGSYGFGGEESAGASFLRKQGTVWTTDKDGIILALLGAVYLKDDIP